MAGLNFSINGKLIIDIAREKFLYESFSAADEFLKECFISIDDETVQKLLSGTHTLDKNLLLIEEPPSSSYPDDIRDHFGCGFYVENGMLKKVCRFFEGIPTDLVRGVDVKVFDHNGHVVRAFYKDDPFRQSSVVDYNRLDNSKISDKDSVEIISATDVFWYDDALYSENFVKLARDANMIGEDENIERVTIPEEDPFFGFDEGWVVVTKTFGSAPVWLSDMLPKSIWGTMTEEFIADLKRYDSDTFEVRRKNLTMGSDSFSKLQLKIKEQADKTGGWIRIPNHNSDESDKLSLGRPDHWMVPRSAFMHYVASNYSVSGSDEAKLYLAEAGKWDPVSPPSFKMQNDNCFHTDVLIGAGVSIHSMYPDTPFYDDDFTVSLQEVYDSELDKISILSRNTKDKIDNQNNDEPPNVVVLCGGGFFSGPVCFPGPGESVAPGSIALIPAATPDYLNAALSAACVLTAQGGGMAHLVNVSRSSGGNIGRISRTEMKKYSEGDVINVRFEGGVGFVSLSSNDHTSTRRP